MYNPESNALLKKERIKQNCPSSLEGEKKALWNGATFSIITYLSKVLGCFHFVRLKDKPNKWLVYVIFPYCFHLSLFRTYSHSQRILFTITSGFWFAVAAVAL